MSLETGAAEPQLWENPYCTGPARRLLNVRQGVTDHEPRVMLREGRSDFDRRDLGGLLVATSEQDSKDRRINRAERGSRFRSHRDGDDNRTVWLRDGPLMCLQLYKLEAAVAAEVESLRQRQRETTAKIDGHVSTIGRAVDAVESDWPFVAVTVFLELETVRSGGSSSDEGRGAVTVAVEFSRAQEGIAELESAIASVVAQTRQDQHRLEQQISGQLETNVTARHNIAQLERRVAGLADDVQRRQREYDELTRMIDEAWPEAMMLLQRQIGQVADDAILGRYARLRQVLGRQDAYFEGWLEHLREVAQAERQAQAERESEQWFYEEAMRQDEELERVRSRPIDELPVSAATRTALASSGIATVGDLLEHDESGLRDIDGIGEVRFNEIEVALRDFGFRTGEC